VQRSSGPNLTFESGLTRCESGVCERGISITLKALIGAAWPRSRGIV
jgi:hypothetical protein